MTSSQVVLSQQTPSAAVSDFSSNKQSAQEMLKIYNQPRNDQMSKILASINTSSQPRDMSQHAKDLALADIGAVRALLTVMNSNDAKNSQGVVQAQFKQREDAIISQLFTQQVNAFQQLFQLRQLQVQSLTGKGHNFNGDASTGGSLGFLNPTAFEKSMNASYQTPSRHNSDNIASMSMNSQKNASDLAVSL